MYRVIIFLFISFISYNITFAKPTLLRSKYLIACLDNGTTGTVSPGNPEYPLVFFSDRDNENAQDSDYWIIKEISPDKYTFQNAASHKYIRYNRTSVDISALVLADSIYKDGSTSWSLNLRLKNNLSYYLIRSAYTSAKVWNKRATSDDGLYPVGVMEMTNTESEEFLFYDMDGNPVNDNLGIIIPKPVNKPSLGAFAGQLDSLTFGGKMPAVDTAKKGFYLSVPENNFSLANVTQRVFYNAKDASNKLFINGTQVNSGSNYTFTGVTGKSTFTLEIKNGLTVLATGTLYFSSLPLVQLYSDASLNSTYALGRIKVTEPDKPEVSEYLLAHLKTRGAYAAGLSKKAFSVKLKDIDGLTSLEKSFFGLRSDNNWIIDAMGIDLSRMRNRVSTDLWNDFSVKPYYAEMEPKMVNGTNGQYIELFLNNSYNGLYCMTEKIDRKQLNLKKVKIATSTTPVVQRGALFKADDWSFESVMGNPLISNNGKLAIYGNDFESWARYSVKYPDFGDGEPIEWKSLYDAVLLCSYLTPEATFNAKAAQFFDLPQVRDYYLFLELILAADNQGKNLYFSIYDQTVSPMISITPWDLDATWGRRWDGSSNVTGPNQSFDTFVANYEHGQSNLFLRLKKLNTVGFRDQLKTRYKELRGSHFNHEQLMARFEKYVTMLKSSGAFDREITRWAGNRVAADPNFDLTFLSTWTTNRLSYLDKQYLGGPYTGLNSLDIKNIMISPNPVQNIMSVQNVQIGDLIQVYNFQGNLILQVLSESEIQTIDMSKFTQGVYIVKVGGLTAKFIKK